MSELFNGTVVTTLSDTDRIASGIPSQVGCKNITFADLRSQLNGGGAITKYKSVSANFTDAIIAGTLIEYIDIIYKTGTPVVSITDSSETLLASDTIASHSLNQIRKYYPATDTLTVNISGGTVTIIVTKFVNYSL